MIAVLDASALLAFLQEENGADQVEAAPSGEAHCSNVNWSEVAQKVRAPKGVWLLAAALLASDGPRVQPATLEDGEHAATLWRRGSGPSLADRFCLALGLRLDATIWTADTTRGSPGRVRQTC